MYLKLIALALALAAASASISTGMEWNATAELLKSHIESGVLRGEVRETINKSHNTTLMQNIYDIISNQTFNHIYERQVFDCTDTSQITANVLQERGFNVHYIYNVNNNTGHMYVAVEDENQTDTYVIIETTWIGKVNPPIGRIVDPYNETKYPYGRGWMTDSPEELWYNPAMGGLKNSTINASNVDELKDDYIARR